MKRFIASGFGVGLFWETFFKNKKGGGPLASLLLTFEIYFGNSLFGIWNTLNLFILFIVLIILYFVTVDDDDASSDPSWITLDEICGMSLVTIGSGAELLPLLSGFLVFRLSDILKQPSFVGELEKLPGKLGVLYDDLGAGFIGLISAMIVNQIIQIIKKFKIPLLGNHNIKNAVAALAVSLTVGISIFDIKKGLKNFKGVQRRFNKIFNFNNVDFYDDYAHHPTEIKEVLDGVKNVYKDYEKICIFQPHRISRLKDLKKEFTYAFKNADKVILFPIYTAGEKLKLGFSYINFAKEIIKNSRVQLFLIDDRFQLAKFIKANIYGKKIVIGMGAGTISGWMRELPKLIS